MQKNEKLILKIEDISRDGEGIGHVDGFTVFVKDALPGDTVRAAVTRPKKTYAYAKMTELIAPGTCRTAARCPEARRCGGCRLQEMDYESQLAFKQKTVKDVMTRIGGLPDVPVLPVIGMEAPFRYRNKTQYPVRLIRDGKKTDGRPTDVEMKTGRRGKTSHGRKSSAADAHRHLAAGFFAGRTHTLIPVEDCLLAPEENAEIVRRILSFAETHGIDAYDEAAGTGLLRHILIRKGFATGQIMVCLIINGDRLPLAEELADELMEIPGMTSVCLNVNKKRTNVILGGKIIPLRGNPWIEDILTEDPSPAQEDTPEIGAKAASAPASPESSAFEKQAARAPAAQESSGDKTSGRGTAGLRFRISPKSFYQVNPAQCVRLYAEALRAAALTGNEIVYDLYCGIGTISLFLARHARAVYGIEIVPDAVRDARANAERNGIKNAHFFAGAAEDLMPRGLTAPESQVPNTAKKSMPHKAPDIADAVPAEKENIPSGDKSDTAFPPADVVVLDPPRKGCDPRLIETVIRMQPARVVYVSCDPATLARDLRIFAAGGYAPQYVRPVDMFPQTTGIEDVCLLVRKEA